MTDSVRQTVADTIGTVLAYWAAEHATRTVLISAETSRAIDYGELARYARRLAKWFDQEGIVPGARIALFLNNGLAMSSLFLGIMAVNRVVTPINLLAQGSQLAYVLEHCEADLLITSEDHRGSVTEAIGSIARAPRILYIDPDSLDWPMQTEGSALRNASHERYVGPDGHEVQVRHEGRGSGLARTGSAATALMMYTSGTTGQPKAAMMSHSNLLYAARAVAAWHALDQDDRVLSALPLYHINGQVIATLAPLVSGGSIVVPRRFSVSTWWQDAERFACTWINLVPTIVAYLLNQSVDEASIARGRNACKTVRFGRCASAPLPGAHHQLFEQRFGVALIEAMGMTESSSVVFCNPMPPALRKSGSPGLPVGVDVRIVSASGEDLADYQQGEIWFRGPNVMQGYFKSPQQTQEALSADGWLRSGDLGHRDADGYFFVTGRLKELIIKGGENIAPREIDEALLKHPAVLEAAAVGMPHREYGQDILACVVLREDATVNSADLLAFCRRELGPFKAPAVIRLVKSLPKGPSGKIQRMKLLDDHEPPR
jgi:acyl-CoA synthetase (AMP-forming)/AMP-acid ligase II